MANYYRYNRMTSGELSRALKAHEMTLDDFLFVTGYTREQVMLWLGQMKSEDPFDYEIPHIVPVFFELLKLGSAKDIAFNLSRRLIKPRADDVRRPERPPSARHGVVRCPICGSTGHDSCADEASV